MVLKPHSRTVGWTLVAFAAFGVLISSLVVWRLYELSSVRWCVLAKAGEVSGNEGCLQVLLKLLEINDHAIMILLGTLALTVISVVVVALGVRINADAPGGFSVDVGVDTTTISAGDSEATIPTPPSVG